jgi:hypothetical protein
MDLRLNVQIDAFNDRASYGNLNVSETVELRNVNFLEISQILGQFHALTVKIQEERKNGIGE